MSLNKYIRCTLEFKVSSAKLVFESDLPMSQGGACCGHWSVLSASRWL